MKDKDIKKLGDADFYFHYNKSTEHFTTITATLVEKCSGFGGFAEEEAKKSGGLLRHIVNQLSNNQEYNKVILCKRYDLSSRSYNFIDGFANAIVGSAVACLEANKERIASKIYHLIEKYIVGTYNGENGDINVVGERPERYKVQGKLKYKIEELERELSHLPNKPNVFVFGKASYDNQPRRENYTSEELYLKAHQLWKKGFTLTRDCIFGARGSSDEIGGNSTYRVEFEGTLPSTINILGQAVCYNRYKFKLSHKGRVLGHIHLNEKEGSELQYILGENNKPLVKTKRRKKGNKHCSIVTQGRIPLRVYFMRVGNSWNVTIGYPMLHAYRAKETLRRMVNGTIGLDFNYGHLEASAVTITDDKMVVLGYKKFAYDISNNVTRGARDNKLYEFIREIVAWAKELGYTITLENLNWEPSKMIMGKCGLSKVLHLMPYKKVRAKFERDCYKHGVHLRYINPRHTSILGNLISTDYPWFSRDVAASVVIALRGFFAGNKYLTKLCIRYRNKDKGNLLRINQKGQFGRHVWIEKSKSNNDNIDRNICTINVRMSDNECKDKIDNSSSRSTIQTRVGNSINKLGNAVSKYYAKHKIKKRTNSRFKIKLVCHASTQRTAEVPVPKANL